MWSRDEENYGEITNFGVRLENADWRRFFKDRREVFWKIWSQNDFLNGELHIIWNLRNFESIRVVQLQSVNNYRKLERSPISTFLRFKVIWSSPFKKVILGPSFVKKFPWILKKRRHCDKRIGAPFRKIKTKKSKTKIDEKREFSGKWRKRAKSWKW